MQFCAGRTQRLKTLQVCRVEGDSSAAEAAVCRGDNSNCTLKMLTLGIGDLASHS